MLLRQLWLCPRGSLFGRRSHPGTSCSTTDSLKFSHFLLERYRVIILASRSSSIGTKEEGVRVVDIHPYDRLEPSWVAHRSHLTTRSPSGLHPNPPFDHNHDSSPVRPSSLLRPGLWLSLDHVVSRSHSPYPTSYGTPWDTPLFYSLPRPTRVTSSSSAPSYAYVYSDRTVHSSPAPFHTHGTAHIARRYDLPHPPNPLSPVFADDGRPPTQRRREDTPTSAATDDQDLLSSFFTP